MTSSTTGLSEFKAILLKELNAVVSAMAYHGGTSEYYTLGELAVLETELAYLLRELNDLEERAWSV